MSENEFPTIADAAAALKEMVDAGLGELPVQVLIVPDSTMQAVARHHGAKDDAKPALMIDLVSADGSVSFTICSTDRMGDNSPRVAVQ